MSAAPEVLSEECGALRRCPLFSSFREKEIEALLQLSWQLSAPAGEVLFERGETGDFLFVIVSGSVRIVNRTANDRERVLALLGPGESVGEMSVLDGEPRSATAIVNRPARLIRIDREDLETVTARFPGVGHRFLTSSVGLVSARLRAANLRLIEVARLGLEARSEIGEMRSRILSLMSHELRTPLTVIRSSANLLRKTGEAAGRQQPFVEMIERQSECLQLLIDDLIALAVLQVGAGIRETSEVDLVALTGEAVEQVQVRAAEKGIRVLRVHRSDTLPLVGDRALLARALRHLLTNAVKFSPQASVVRVETEVVPGESTVRLSVIDEGPGIRAHRLESMLQPFVQEENPLTREVDGLGVGLSLAKGVAEAHGGRLLVESEAGKGSRFVLELPCGHTSEDRTQSEG